MYTLLDRDILNMEEICNHLEYISSLTFALEGSAKILDLLDKIYCISTVEFLFQWANWTCSPGICFCCYWVRFLLVYEMESAQGCYACWRQQLQSSSSVWLGGGPFSSHLHPWDQLIRISGHSRDTSPVWWSWDQCL